MIIVSQDYNVIVNFDQIEKIHWKYEVEHKEEGYYLYASIRNEDMLLNFYKDSCELDQELNNIEECYENNIKICFLFHELPF